MLAGNCSVEMTNLVQLLPLLSVTFLNLLPPNEPVYSLSKTYSYDQGLTTQKGIKFYAKSHNFEQDYPLNSQERVKLEEIIENEYFSSLSHNCRLETQRLRWGYQQQTPHCDMLKQSQALAL